MTTSYQQPALSIPLDGESGLFLVQGRRYGDDDDTCEIMQAGSLSQATEDFLKKHLGCTDEEIEAAESNTQNDPPFFIIKAEDITSTVKAFCGICV